MEGFALFLSIVMLVFGVLQIILFFKLWGMTNDMSDVAKNIKMLTRHFCKKGNESTPLNNVEIESTNAIEIEAADPVYGKIKAHGITYVVTGSKVVFSDGVQGEIKHGNDYYIQCSFITKDNKELFYKDVDYTCAALYEYLTINEILLDGFLRNAK